MTKELKLFNGRTYGVLPSAYWRDSHLYIAAYNMADVMRVCTEAGLQAPTRNEITTYWSKGQWGNSMDGIAVERGIWVKIGYSNPPIRIKCKNDLTLLTPKV